MKTFSFLLFLLLCSQALAQTDTDEDGVPDDNDNCVLVTNLDQLDTDGDGLGNVCDTDDDNDGTVDSRDAFPLDAAEISDLDGDNIGDNADTDDDNDGTADASDVFPGVDYQGVLTFVDLSETAMPFGLVSFLDSAVEDPAVNMGQSLPSWYLRPDGTYVATGYPRHEGTWIAVDEGYVLTQDDNGGISYPTYDASFDNVNASQLAQDPLYSQAGQIEVRERSITRIAVRAGKQEAELWQLAVQTRYEQFAVDPSLAIDPTKPVRVNGGMGENVQVEDVMIIAPTATFVPFSSRELVGSWTLEDLNLDAVDATSHCTVGYQCADILTFNADGTAITEISRRSATWLITGSGGLEVTFADTGVQMLVDRLVQGPDTSTVVTQIDAPDGYDAAVLPMIKRSAPAPTDITAFYGVMLSNGFTVTNPDELYVTVSPFDGGFIGNFGFVLNADGSGRRASVSSNFVTINGVEVEQGFAQVRDITWTQTGSQVTSEYCIFERDYGSGPACRYLQTRTWDLIAVTDTRLYVHERLMLERDNDGDGVLESIDYKLSRPNFYELTPYYDVNDVDRDGYTNDVDVFPTDPTEWEDTNDNGIGDNAEPGLDGDGDGVLNEADAFSWDAAASVDTDGDGQPDDWNAGASQEQINASFLVLDADDDNDGVPDSNDAFPLDAGESADTDGDGIGNNADTDDDGDGVADSVDALPLDADETLDTDNDGIGNNADTDDDGDGYTDQHELEMGSDPLDSADMPRSGGLSPALLRVISQGVTKDDGGG